MRFRLLVVLAVLAAGSAQAGLVHSYDFTSGVTDLTGTENGTLVDGATVSGGVLSLDGSGYAQFGSHLVPTSGSYAVVLDFRLTAAPSGLLELISQGTTGGFGFYIGRSSGGVFRASDSWLSTSVGFPADALWHQVALVVDSAENTSTLFLDGTAQDTLGSAIISTSGGSNTRFGRQFSPFDEFFTGEIDNVRIYDSAIAPQELAGTPEPSAFLLMAGGAAGLLVRRRKSHR